LEPYVDNMYIKHKHKIEDIFSSTLLHGSSFQLITTNVVENLQPSIWQQVKKFVSKSLPQDVNALSISSQCIIHSLESQLWKYVYNTQTPKKYDRSQLTRTFNYDILLLIFDHESLQTAWLCPTLHLAFDMGLHYLIIMGRN